VCVCVCVCVSGHNSGKPGAFIYIPQGGWCGRQGIWMIHIVEEIKLLLLTGNRLKHIRGNVRYLVTWNIKVFTVGYFLRLDK
jgi:hypothetical protein